MTGLYDRRVFEFSKRSFLCHWTDRLYQSQKKICCRRLSFISELLEGLLRLRWRSSKQPWLKQSAWLEKLQAINPKPTKGKHHSEALRLSSQNESYSRCGISHHWESKMHLDSIGKSLSKPYFKLTKFYQCDPSTCYFFIVWIPLYSNQIVVLPKSATSANAKVSLVEIENSDQEC